MPRMLLAKADNALKTSSLARDADDCEGAVNRAYFAMFHAARAALAARGVGAGARTHGSVIAAFGIELIRSGAVARDLGRWLNAAQELRNLVDYDRGMFQDVPETDLVLERSRTFVRTIGLLLGELREEKP